MERPIQSGHGLNQRLAAHQRIGLDTSIFIYHLEANQRYLPLTRALLSRVQSGHVVGITSVVTLMEVTVRPWQLGQIGAARQYEILLLNFPNLQVLDIERNAARQAARLRARYRVRPADALQAATALSHGASGFITNDRKLQRLTGELEVMLLDDFLAGA